MLALVISTLAAPFIGRWVRRLLRDGLGLEGRIGILVFLIAAGLDTALGSCVSYLHHHI